MDSVPGNRVASRLQDAAHVPHLVLPVLGIVPNSVAENHGCRVAAGLLPRLVGFKDGIFRMILSGVESSSQRCPLDQKIIDKKLPPHVDGDDLGRRGQIRNRHRLKRQGGRARGPD